MYWDNIYALKLLSVHCIYGPLGLSFICEIACVAPSLLLLPVEVSVQVIKILRPQLHDDEAGCIFQSLGCLVNFKVPDFECDFHVFPPCQKCIMCHNDLVKYNEPVIVDYFHLLGKSKGVRVSLKVQPVWCFLWVHEVRKPKFRVEIVPRGKRRCWG